MTKDEILKMEAGREMDDLVAEKVMGWHKGNYVYPDGKSLSDKNDEWLDAEDHYVCGVAPEDSSYEDDEDFNLIHWHPSGSMLWAWDAVERVYQLGLRRKYVSSLVAVIIHDFGETSLSEEYHADAHKQCRAALLAVMEEK